MNRRKRDLNNYGTLLKEYCLTSTRLMMNYYNYKDLLMSDRLYCEICGAGLSSDDAEASVCGACGSARGIDDSYGNINTLDFEDRAKSVYVPDPDLRYEEE